MVKNKITKPFYLITDIGREGKRTFKITLNNHQDDLELIDKYYDCWLTLNQIIRSYYKGPNELTILNSESEFNIEGSIILALNGYYKQAISLLRSWFETSLYGIYFVDHPVEFDKWSLGIKSQKGFRINFSNELIPYIFQFRNFLIFEEERKKIWQKYKSLIKFKTFREHIDNLYDELSAHIHGRGYHRSSLSSIEFNKFALKMYNKKNFQFWMNLFIHVHQSLVLSFLLYNPKLLNKHRKKRITIKECLPDYYKDILKKKFNVKF